MRCRDAFLDGREDVAGEPPGRVSSAASRSAALGAVCWTVTQTPELLEGC
jgi:hypothetical protein